MPRAKSKPKQDEEDRALMDIAARVSAKLAALGCPRIAKDTERYMKAVVRSHGLRMKQVEEFVKHEVDLVSGHEELSLQLLKSPFQEEKEIGIRTWRKGDNALREQIFEAGFITGWAACDSACIRILKPLVKSEESVRVRLADWGVNAANLWTVRASCVGFIGTVKDESCRIHALKAAKYALTESSFSQERFVQLGAGWILREIGEADRALADEFLEKYLTRFIPEGLRYATEKLSVTKRGTWRAKLKELQETKKQKLTTESEDQE